MDGHAPIHINSLHTYVYQPYISTVKKNIMYHFFISKNVMYDNCVTLYVKRLCRGLPLTVDVALNALF